MLQGPMSVVHLAIQAPGHPTATVSVTLVDLLLQLPLGQGHADRGAAVADIPALVTSPWRVDLAKATAASLKPQLAQKGNVLWQVLESHSELVGLWEGPAQDVARRWIPVPAASLRRGQRLVSAQDGDLALPKNGGR